jgi:hypothetical protein
MSADARIRRDVPVARRRWSLSTLLARTIRERFAATPDLPASAGLRSLRLLDVLQGARLRRPSFARLSAAGISGVS